jgi:hypothetical protein
LEAEEILPLHLLHPVFPAPFLSFLSAYAFKVPEKQLLGTFQKYLLQMSKLS